MESISQPAPRNPKWMTIVGWVLTLLPMPLFFLGLIMLLNATPEMSANMEKMGWDIHTMKWVVIAELISAILYLIPPTSVLGAILLTGYLGGAVATHARLHEAQLVVPVVFGITIWGGLFLRDLCIRALIPIRR